MSSYVCHAEQSEASIAQCLEFLRVAQKDKKEKNRNCKRIKAICAKAKPWVILSEVEGVCWAAMGKGFRTSSLRLRSVQARSE